MGVGQSGNADPRSTALAERLLASSDIIVVCAPPGFGNPACCARPKTWRAAMNAATSCASTLPATALTRVPPPMPFSARGKATSSSLIA